MKTFETEYKNQIAIELPDLWDRIEAGVDAYEATKNETVTAKADEIKENKITAISRKRTFITIAKVITAAACLLLVINVFRIVGSNKNMATSEATTNNMYMTDTADSAPAEETATSEACEDVAEWEADDVDAAAPSQVEESATVASKDVTNDVECEATTQECAPEEVMGDFAQVTEEDADSILTDGIVVYAAGHWIAATDDKRELKECDDLTIISNLFDCDKKNAQMIQSILREGDIGKVEYGFYKALSPEVISYMQNDSAFDGVDTSLVSITSIETVDKARYVVFTTLEDETRVLEIVRIN